jgi:hypothetical protein
MRAATALFVIGAWAFLLGLPQRYARGEMIDLRGAAVLAPGEMTAREKKATEMLLDEVEARTQIRWPVVQSRPAGQMPVVVVGVIGAMKKIAAERGASIPSGNDLAEGYRIWIDRGAVCVAGNDERGVLFGVGRLLREMRLSRQHIQIADDLKIDSAPQMKIRGHQLGYRPKCNSYDGWTVAIWEQYIRDLTIFGCNTIELIPPRSDDNPDSPLFPLPQMRMMTEMSRLADEYGLDVSIWYPAMDENYSKPVTVDFALKEWGDVFAKLPRVDALFVPGGDPGHTRPKHLLALLERQAENLHRYHPKAKIWVSPQSFDKQWLEEFFDLLRQEPKWLDGIVYGPQIRIPLSECRRLTPSRYPIRNYPDITHTQHCQYPVPDWDLAYAVTEGREPVCPRPTQMANIFRLTRPDTIGFVTYSEGCNDDVNKVVWSALGWDPDADVTQVLREYARYFIGPDMEEGFAQGILSLERNWRGAVIANDGIKTTLEQFNAMEKAAFPRAKLAWRFQQAIYRANYDAYVHDRLQSETQLEQRAMEQLSRADKLGSLTAMGLAQETLERAVSEPVAGQARARTFEMAEALFQSIRMQLSVPRYDAESVGRGANLDRIDAPLNNRRWLEKQFDDIRKLDSESQRLSRINEIVHWTDPGPGGFYDDLGNLLRQPHLVIGLGWEKDPDFYHTANVRVEDFRDGGSTSPMSWWSTAGSLYDAPLRMHYDNLDRTAHYTLRVVYPPADERATVRLVANDQYEIHPAMRRESQRLEFPIPPEATATGHLDLAWIPPQGLGHNGRNVQVAEVWLVKN